MNWRVSCSNPRPLHWPCTPLDCITLALVITSTIAQLIHTHADEALQKTKKACKYHHEKADDVIFTHQIQITPQ